MGVALHSRVCKPYLTDEQINQVSLDDDYCYIADSDTTSFLYVPRVGFSFFPKHKLQCLDDSFEMEIVLKDGSSIDVTLSIQTINMTLVKKLRDESLSKKEKQALLKNASPDYKEGYRYAVM